LEKTIFSFKFALITLIMPFDSSKNFLDMLRKNDLLNDRYLMEERIGQGGFSVVWRAYDTAKQNTQVAVKIFRPQQGLSPKDIHQFEVEYQFTQKLNDSRLLKATDYFVYEDSPCLVFKYMEGGSLYDKIQSEGSLTEQEVGKVIYQVSGALSYLHTRHTQAVLHLDIKPDNILINYAGDYLLSDFGISMDMRSTMLRGSQLKGESLQYRAPERVLNQGLGTPADIFAFGVTLWECCNGLLNDNGSSLGERVAAGHALQSFDESRYSKRLESIVHACLRRAPEQRLTAPQLEQLGKHYVENGYWDLLPAAALDYGQPVYAMPSASSSSSSFGKQTVPLGGAPIQRPVTYDAEPTVQIYSQHEPYTQEKKKNRLLLPMILAGAFIAGIGGMLFWNNSTSETSGPVAEVKKTPPNEPKLPEKKSDKPTTPASKPLTDEKPNNTSANTQPTAQPVTYPKNEPQPTTRPEVQSLGVQTKLKPIVKPTVVEKPPTEAPTTLPSELSFDNIRVTKTPDHLSITRVVLRASETAISFRLSKGNTTGYQFSIYGPGNANAFFIKCNGVSYKLRRGSGVSFTEGQTLSSDRNFTLYFDPLPMSTRLFDLSEGSNQLDETQQYWNFKGVRLQ